MIKYVNICVDKDGYIPELIEKIDKGMPKLTSLTRESLKKRKTLLLITDILLPIVLMASNVSIDLSTQGKITAGTVFVGIMFLANFIWGIISYKILESKLNMDEKRKEAKEGLKEASKDISFEEALDSLERKDLLKYFLPAKFLWVCCCTDAASFSFMDGGLAVAYAKDNVIKGLYSRSVIDKSDGNPNTISITDNGVFLANYDGPLSHAKESILLDETESFSREGLDLHMPVIQLIGVDSSVEGGYNDGLESESKLQSEG